MTRVACREIFGGSQGQRGPEGPFNKGDGTARTRDLRKGVANQIFVMVNVGMIRIQIVAMCQYVYICCYIYRDKGR